MEQQELKQRPHPDQQHHSVCHAYVWCASHKSNGGLSRVTALACPHGACVVSCLCCVVLCHAVPQAESRYRELASMGLNVKLVLVGNKGKQYFARRPQYTVVSE